MLQSVGLQRIGHDLVAEQQPRWLLLRRTLTGTPGDNKTHWCHSHWLASNGTEQGGKQETVEQDGKWSFTIFLTSFLLPEHHPLLSESLWIRSLFLSCVLDLIFFFPSLAIKGNRYKRENTFSKESPGNHFYWSVVALQCWVSFCYIAKWISHKCIYIYPLFFEFPSYLGHHRALSR